MKNHFLQFVLFLLVCASCADSVDVDNTDQEIESSKKAFYELQMKEKGFSLEINGACDDALEDTLHERAIAYLDSDTERIVEFKFKEACCQEYLGDYEIKNDSLTFTLEQVNEEVCSCICWYRYKLNLNGIKENYNTLEVKVK